MKKTLLYSLLVLLSLIILFIIFRDIFSQHLNQENPYQYELGDVNYVDPGWVTYQEVKRISTELSDPKALAYHKGRLGIAYQDHIQVIDTTGQEYFQTRIENPSTCIAFDPEGNIYLGSKEYISIYDPGGNPITSWGLIDSASYITSIAFKGDRVFLADAGNHMVHIYDSRGERIHSFDGKVPGKNDYGFVVPSPYFDVAVDPDGQLWVANTGLQSVENFTDQGVFRSYWGESSFSIEGFIGCCNPAQFCIQDDGSFITAEKGSVRIKVYTAAGELEGVVATPGDFDADSEPPDISVDENGGVYALDITRKMIRKFKPKG